MPCLQSVLLMLLAYYEFMHAQTMQISHYRQHSETKCTEGLLSGDIIIFKAEVDYREDPKMKYVFIYIKKKMDILPDASVYNLQDDFTMNRTCCQRMNTNRVIITIKMNVTKTYSDAKIYGRLITTKAKEIVSEFQHFPKIYDYSDIDSVLNVNGKNISPKDDTCVISLDVPDVIIFFACQSQISPCLIEISSTDSTKLIQRNYSAAYITSKKKSKDIDVTIRYGACRLDKTPFVIRCTLKTEKRACTELNQLKDSKSNSDDPISCFYCPIIFCNIAIIIVSASVTAILVKRCFRYKRNHKDQNNELQVSKRNHDHPSIELNPLFQVDKEEQQKATTKFLRDFKCDKNPGHESFYTVHDFELSHIEKDYRLEILYQLIKCISKLTVSILVSFKSQARYNVKQRTDDMSPDYYIAEKKGFKLKTGMIISVEKNCENKQSQCPCQSCKTSGNPSSSWGKVFVLTSSTVVFDNNEAEKSSFNLFYNSHNSEAYTLYGSCVSENNVDEGWCIVECPTCDLHLFERLDHFIISCSDKMNKINTKLNREEKGDFVCIVSHPHDFPKQITIGKFEKRKISKMIDTTEQTIYQYSTPTCHGSAGAFVYILGVSDLSAKHFHVHLGVNDSGKGYCSIGKEEKTI
ncbi:unnamed protein product [Lymnaea stagnalis]|uniref:Uncharacterized protein n=1 Tax=Lymnaea stagnalis TaxID=6523 RepID=A0AAV2HEQ5_LYMST